jgi:predicted alpha/beta-fold hydrolase
VSGLLRAGRAAGWTGVAFNFRSCSGELNRLPRFYHSGETGDLAWVIESLVARAPGVPIGAVGVSLGGNVLLKWLGEVGETAHRELMGAVGISVPFDVAACARVLDRGLHRLVYAHNFLRTMRSKVVEKARRYPGFVDVRAMRRARTFARYDRIVTAPLTRFGTGRLLTTSSAALPARSAGPPFLSARDDPIVAAPCPGPLISAEHSRRVHSLRRPPDSSRGDGARAPGGSGAPSSSSRRCCAVSQTLLRQFGGRWSVPKSEV